MTMSHGSARTLAMVARNVGIRDGCVAPPVKRNSGAETALRLSA
jgi:hypothetical protein